ncbi:MAG: SpoIIE family protein phosphatase [Actinomycetota bacterium]|nr:SpoIIE family protein phosphatase [Actinomycetota bacterium]
MVADLSRDEAARMAAVRRYDVLDSPPDGAFDRITSLAARLFEVPIALVTIVDTDRIWFKSQHGLDAGEIGRDPGLCASAILQDAPYLVNDAATDPRTLSNPLVAGELGLRFYAAAPLTTHDGHNLGTLCVIDRQPRELTESELSSLRDLASVVVDELELRLSARRTVGLEADLRHLAEELAGTLQESLLPTELPAVEGLELAARYHVAHRDQVGGDFYDVFLQPTSPGCVAVVGDISGKGALAASLTGTARWALRTVALDERAPSEGLARLNTVLFQAHSEPNRYCTLALAAIRPRDDGGADLTISLAGHPPPLLVEPDGTVERLGTTGPIAGWFQDPVYSDSSRSAPAGSVLLLFTDGLLEAIGGHACVSDEPLQAVLRRVAGRGASEVADALDAALPAGELSDDAAFLVIRVGEVQ